MSLELEKGGWGLPQGVTIDFFEVGDTIWSNMYPERKGKVLGKLTNLFNLKGYLQVHWSDRPKGETDIVLEDWVRKERQVTPTSKGASRGPVGSEKSILMEVGEQMEEDNKLTEPADVDEASLVLPFVASEIVKKVGVMPRYVDKFLSGSEIRKYSGSDDSYLIRNGMRKVVVSDLHGSVETKYYYRGKEVSPPDFFNDDFKKAGVDAIISRDDKDRLILKYSGQRYVITEADVQEIADDFGLDRDAVVFALDKGESFTF